MDNAKPQSDAKKGRKTDANMKIIYEQSMEIDNFSERSNSLNNSESYCEDFYDR